MDLPLLRAHGSRGCIRHDTQWNGASSHHQSGFGCGGAGHGPWITHQVCPTTRNRHHFSSRCFPSAWQSLPWRPGGSKWFIGIPWLQKNPKSSSFISCIVTIPQTCWTMRWVPFYLCRTTVAKLLCLYGIDCSCPHHWRDWLNFRSCLIDIVVCLHCCSHIIRQHHWAWRWCSWQGLEHLFIILLLISGCSSSMYVYSVWCISSILGTSGKWHWP